MVMVSKFSNFPDKLSENDELREYESSESDGTSTGNSPGKVSILGLYHKQGLK